MVLSTTLDTIVPTYIIAYINVVILFLNLIQKQEYITLNIHYKILAKVRDICLQLLGWHPMAGTTDYTLWQDR